MFTFYCNRKADSDFWVTYLSFKLKNHILFDLRCIGDLFQSLPLALAQRELEWAPADPCDPAQD